MPAIGATLNGRYRILEKLGEGGQSKVYIAADVGSDSKGRVIIKEMISSPDEQEQNERFSLFSAEYSLLKNLNHPLLIKVYGLFEENGNYYLAEEYVQGLTLEKILRKEPVLDEDRAGQITIDLADVLGYLHSNNIIYRDLKPSNIIIQSDQKARLIDFTIARTFKEGQAKDTVLIGTPGYAPPEQIGRSQTDCRSDVYSLGVLLYQMITGIDPVIDGYSFKVIFSEPFPKLKPVIEKATQLKCDDRYQTMADFKKDLVKHLAKKTPQLTLIGSKPSLPPSVPVSRPVISQPSPPVTYVVPFSSSAQASSSNGMIIPIIYLIVFIFLGVLILGRGSDKGEGRYQQGFYTEMLTAIDNNDLATVKKILKYNPSAARAYYVDHSMLHRAIRKGHTQIALLLIEKGADVNRGDSINMTPLHRAAEMGNAAVVKVLLVKGANANIRARDDYNSTPLYYAVKKGNMEIIKLLIAHSSKNSSGTALHLHTAVRSKNKELVKLFLEQGVNINLKLGNGFTALHIAAYDGSADLVRFLLAKGAEINAKSDAGDTPLHMAVNNRYKNLAVVQLLLAKGADVNAKNQYKNTALHKAVEYGDTKMVKLLLTKGANANAKDTFGKTPLQLAKEKDSEIEKILRQHGAK